MRASAGASQRLRPRHQPEAGGGLSLHLFPASLAAIRACCPCRNQGCDFCVNGARELLLSQRLSS